MNTIPILPKEITIRKNDAVKFDIQVGHLILHVSVILIVSFYDNVDNLVLRENVTLEGEEYSNWGTDDNYLIQKVCEKLDLDLADMM